MSERLSGDLTVTEFGAIIPEERLVPPGAGPAIAQKRFTDRAGNATTVSLGGGMERRWLYVALLSLGCLGLRVGFAQPADQAPDTMEARVTACAPCHGAKGEGTDNAYFPRLAGKPAGYLANQLHAFHTGRRRYPPMNYLLAYLPEDYLKQIAEYFAAQRPPLPTPAVPAVSKDVLARGESLVTHGDAAAGIPACSSCHGPHLTGMEPAIPGLLGLRATYISAQLGAWRYGTRTATAPDCMQIVAGHLTEDDVKAIAAVLPTRPAPPDPSPAAQGAFILPFACGSEPQ
jgi:cytochrome c553